MTRQYLKDLFERVASTFLETVAGSLVMIQVVVGTTGTQITGTHQLEATLASAGTAAGASLLKGMAATLRGDPNSASLASSVTVPAPLVIDTAKVPAGAEISAAGAAPQTSGETPPEAPQGAAPSPGAEVPPAAGDTPSAEQAGAPTLPAPTGV